MSVQITIMNYIYIYGIMMLDGCYFQDRLKSPVLLGLAPLARVACCTVACEVFCFSGEMGWDMLKPGTSDIIEYSNDVI